MIGQIKNRFYTNCHGDTPSETFRSIIYELLQRMSRQNRLRTARCYYPHLRPIAPSKYKNFGQFLQFVKGKYGRNRQKRFKQSSSIRQRGLLGRFLEFEDGTFQFWMASCEIISFICLFFLN